MHDVKKIRQNEPFRSHARHPRKWETIQQVKRNPLRGSKGQRDVDSKFWRGGKIGLSKDIQA